MKHSLKLLFATVVSSSMLAGCALTADPVKNIEQTNTLTEQKQVSKLLLNPP